MISSRSHTREWVMGIRETSPGKDPILIEKMIMALTLVEDLRLGGLNFIFKGGTSLILLLGTPHRFSIDIDIVLAEGQNLDERFQAILRSGVFHRYEEDQRGGDLPKQHYKFFFNSVIESKESYILLDILLEENPYPLLQKVEIRSPLLSMEGETTRVSCPAVECLLGDKLTAFAPHTTGIPYGVNKDLEMAKQLFDIGLLFDAAADLKLVGASFKNIASKQLAYHALNELTPVDVLQDAFRTACLVGTRGLASNAEHAELSEGIKKLAGFVYSGHFSPDLAIRCAAKAAYLAALIQKHENTINRFESGLDISVWSISNPDHNKLNKLKKTNPEAFFYYFRALELLNLI